MKLLRPRWINPVAAFCSMICLTVTGSAQETATRYDVDRDVVYTTADDVDLRLDAYIPQDRQEKRPAILVVHGGAWRSGSKTQLALYAAALARRGYAAFAINYRLAPKYRFPAQIEDCRAAVRWVRTNAAKYQVDADRLGAIGYSAGGHLVTLLACTANDKDNRETHIHAVVAGGAPCDFRKTPEQSQFLSFWLGGSRNQLPEVYLAASPAAFVTKNAPPMFLFCGEEDRLVKPDSPRAMVKALQNAKVDASFHLVPKGGHIGTAVDREALDKSWSFFDRHLKNHSTP